MDKKDKQEELWLKLSIARPSECGKLVKQLIKLNINKGEKHK